MVLLDSYSETNQNAEGKLRDLHPSDSVEVSQRGQSFTCPGAYKITSAKFYMKKAGLPTGNGHAVLYAHTGTYGTSSLPTGVVLATSDDFDVSTLGGALALITFTFTGIQQYIMSPGIKYCILFENPTAGTIDVDNYPIMGHDNSTPTHGGNKSEFVNGSYVADPDRDVCFYVYGDLSPPANPLISKPFISPDMIKKAKIR